MNLLTPLTDALFEPLAASQRLTGARFRADATANEILLEVAELHIEALAAEAILKAHRETARQGSEVAQLTRSYARAEQGREADAERAATLLSLSEIEGPTSGGRKRPSADVRLSQRLHLDQAVRLEAVAARRGDRRIESIPNCRFQA